MFSPRGKQIVQEKFLYLLLGKAVLQSGRTRMPDRPAQTNLFVALTYFQANPFPDIYHPVE